MSRECPFWLRGGGGGGVGAALARIRGGISFVMWASRANARILLRKRKKKRDCFGFDDSEIDGEDEDLGDQAGGSRGNPLVQFHCAW